MRRRTVGLRTQLVVGFVGVATLAVLAGAALTTWGLQEAFHGPDVRPVEGGSGDAVIVANHHALQREIDSVHVWAALFSVLVAAAIGLALAARLSRPLRRLTAAATSVPAGGRLAPHPEGSTEIAALAASLDTLAVDLDRQRAGRRRLAQDLAHELRTPLTLIQGRIEAMQDGVRPLDAEGLGALHTETLRLTRLVDRIERIAEAEAGPRAPEDAPLDLAEIARTAHRTHAGAFALRDTELHLSAQAAPCRGDRDALNEVVANLLANSLRYSAPTHAVTLSTATSDGQAVLTVEDGGVLEPDEREAVFARFHRGSAATVARAAGSGLGLTIARETARRHGGDLVLEPVAGGTRARLSLPARPAG